MSRRKLRVILATISLVLFALSIVTFLMYAYVNAELYMDYHKRGIVIVDIYMASYAGLMGIMFIYSIIKLILAIAINNEKYARLVEKFKYGLIVLYIILWVVLIGAAGFISTVLFLPLSTICFVVGIALMMVISLVFYIDVKAARKGDAPLKGLDSVHVSMPQQPNRGKASQDDLKDVYDKLLAQGLISQEEYNRRMNNRIV